MHGAGAALSDAATEFRSGHAQNIAQHPEQRHLGGCIERLLGPVDLECKHSITSVSQSLTIGGRLSGSHANCGPQGADARSVGARYVASLLSARTRSLVQKCYLLCDGRGDAAEAGVGLSEPGGAPFREIKLSHYNKRSL